jgi:AraC-like DNA-binding protein
MPAESVGSGFGATRSTVFSAVEPHDGRFLQAPCAGLCHPGVMARADLTESQYEERPPAPGLANFVDSLWCQQIAPGGNAPYSQRVLPDGCVDALWRDGVLSVAGPDTRWRMVRVPAGSSIVAVRFRPGAARLLFGDMPASEVRDQQADLADLWGARQVRELTERLGEAESPWAAADVLQGAALARLPHSSDVDPMVRAAVRVLDTRRPAPVTVVAERFGLSERQLRRRFVAAVGYGPKTLEGVFRMRRAMSLSETISADGARLRAADVAMAAGYADQSHMTREMRRLTGMTPGELLVRR